MKADAMSEGDQLVNDQVPIVCIDESHALWSALRPGTFYIHEGIAYMSHEDFERVRPLLVAQGIISPVGPLQ